MKSYSQFFPKFLLIVAIIFYFLTNIAATAEDGWSFGKSKKLAKDIYSDNQVTFYCGCDYQTKGTKLIPDWDSCDYFPRNEYTNSGKVNSRSLRIEWEHVMPAWFFGSEMKCWKKGGRKACKKDKQFEKMEADLHNLVPAIGEINGDRSNFAFANIEGEKKVYGECDFEINFKDRVVEPREAIKGDIARIYFYMSETYNVPLNQKLQEMLQYWSTLDPVDQKELERNSKIFRIQGNSNRFVDSEQIIKKGSIFEVAPLTSTSTKSGSSADVKASKVIEVRGYSKKSKLADDF
jgi:deoxyribonuclease-1